MAILLIDFFVLKLGEAQIVNSTTESPKTHGALAVYTVKTPVLN